MRIEKRNNMRRRNLRESEVINFSTLSEVDAEELQRLLAKFQKRLDWHRDLFNKVEDKAIAAVDAALNGSDREELYSKAVEFYYAIIDVEAAHDECRNILNTTDSADAMYDILKKIARPNSISRGR